MQSSSRSTLSSQILGRRITRKGFQLGGHSTPPSIRTKDISDRTQAAEDEEVIYIQIPQLLNLLRPLLVVNRSDHVACGNVLQQRLVLVIHNWGSGTTDRQTVTLESRSVRSRNPETRHRSSQKGKFRTRGQPQKWNFLSEPRYSLKVSS